MINLKLLSNPKADSSKSPRGRAVEEQKALAQLLGGRAIVWDVKQAAKLYKEGFYGKFIGVSKPKDQVPERPLELSLIETYYLACLLYTSDAADE